MGCSLSTRCRALPALLSCFALCVCVCVCVCLAALCVCETDRESVCVEERFSFLASTRPLSLARVSVSLRCCPSPCAMSKAGAAAAAPASIGNDTSDAGSVWTTPYPKVRRRGRARCPPALFPRSARDARERGGHNGGWSVVCGLCIGRGGERRDEKRQRRTSLVLHASHSFLSLSPLSSSLSTSSPL